MQFLFRRAPCAFLSFRHSRNPLMRNWLFGIVVTILVNEITSMSNRLEILPFLSGGLISAKIFHRHARALCMKNSTKVSNAVDAILILSKSLITTGTYFLRTSRVASFNRSRITFNISTEFRECILCRSRGIAVIRHPSSQICLRSISSISLTTQKFVLNC